MSELITATSFYVPTQCITNEELADSYNQYVTQYNVLHSDKPIELSSSEFIYKASGIKQRFVHDKENILDINFMKPQVNKRADHELSLQAEFSLKASLQAISKAGIEKEEIDAIIVSCSNFQRPYPGIAVELQKALGINNAYAFDMNAGCASAVFGISIGSGLIRGNLANKVLIVTPELYSFHVNFRDRKSHFIFGDGCSAVILERKDAFKNGFEIKDISLASRFSNNIRNNFGFINSAENDNQENDKLFNQIGKNVREEVVPLSISHIKNHIDKKSWSTDQVKRLWIHQANKNMLTSIAEQVFGKNFDSSRMPLTIDKYANTAGSSVIGCFNEYNNDFHRGEKGIICAFGAGYSIGSILVEKI